MLQNWMLAPTAFAKVRSVNSPQYDLFSDKTYGEQRSPSTPTGKSALLSPFAFCRIHPPRQLFFRSANGKPDGRYLSPTRSLEDRECSALRIC
jgi:hypothetical protein